MKTPFGKEVALGPGHTVLDGTSYAAKGAQQPPVLADVYCGYGRPSQVLLSSCANRVVSPEGIRERVYVRKDSRNRF